jgi:hypothetical protein
VGKKRSFTGLIAEEEKKSFVERQKEGVSNKKRSPKNGLSLWPFTSTTFIVLHVPVPLNERKQYA